MCLIDWYWRVAALTSCAQMAGFQIVLQAKAKRKEEELNASRKEVLEQGLGVVSWRIGKSIRALPLAQAWLPHFHSNLLCTRGPTFFHRSPLFFGGSMLLADAAIVFGKST